MRGVADVCIVVHDGLNGLPDAITTVSRNIVNLAIRHAAQNLWVHSANTGTRRHEFSRTKDDSI